MKKISLIWLIAAMAFLPSLTAADRFEVLSLSGPATAAPGEKITVNMTIKVLEVDTPIYLRPAAQYNFPADKKIKNLPADQMTPWKIEKFKVGDTLKLAATFTLPENLTMDKDGSLRFMIYRSNNRTWARFEKKLPTYTFKVAAPPSAKLVLPKDTARPTAVLSQTAQLPVIDGSADDEAWQNAPVLSLAFNSQTGKKLAAPAQLKLLTDYRKLYLLLIAPEKIDPQSLVRFDHRDGALWKNEGLECIIAPERTNNDYLQFMSDPADQQYDGFNADTAGFNPPWESRSAVHAQQWIIEAAIPLSAISSKPVQDGTVWRINFFRNGKKYNAAWHPTMGSHSTLNRFGLLVFGSMQQALQERCRVFEEVKNAQSPEMKKLLQQAAAIPTDENSRSAEKFTTALALADTLSEKLRSLQFAERFSASGSPLVVQYADPYAPGVPKAGSEPFAGELKADFYRSEVRDFAVNLTNTGKETLTVRCGLFAPKNGKFQYNTASVDYLYTGIPGFQTKFFTVASASAFDGTPTGDVLAPNPAGVFTIAPGMTRQLFISVQAPAESQDAAGQLVIDSIDGHKFPSVILPVKFTVRNSVPAPELRPFAFGWDYMHEPVIADRPEYTKKHYAMLKEYGFNATLISNLRHLPRPRATADGRIPEQLDFSRLRRQLELTGKFDYYYLDIAIWNQKLQNRELFYLDFYDPAYAKAFKSWLKLVLAELAQHGINSSNLLLCPIDEAADKRAEIIASWIKAVDPELKVIIDCATNNMQQLADLDRYVDVWMPHMRTLPQEALNEFHNYVKDNNKIRYAYYYSAGGEEKIKSPYADYILNFYRLYAKGFSGLGFWAAGQYYGDPWYRKAYPGVYDTSLLYPAIDGPIPSRRLAAWRRGVQDLWLLRSAEARLQNDAAAADELRKAAAGAASFPGDPARSEELRQYCRKLLEK